MIDSILVAFFNVYIGFTSLLFKLGAPAWMVNASRMFVPDCLMLSASRAFQRSRDSDGVMPSSGIKAIGFIDVGRTPTQAVRRDAPPPVGQQAKRAGGSS